VIIMPSYYFVKRLTGFLSTPERKDWVGLDAGCSAHVGVLAEYGLDAEDIVHKKFTNPDYPYEKFIHGNIYDMPIEDKTFDYVVSSHVIEHIEWPLDALSEMIRVAKKMVIANVPRYTLKQEEITPCVKLDQYYLGNHPELWEKYGLKDEDLKWKWSGYFGNFEAPHCAWYPNPSDLVDLFKKTELFEQIKAEVCPDNCGESNVFGWLKQ